MTEVLPAPSDYAWDVVLDGGGFSAEASAERDLSPAEVAAFEAATAQLRPVVRAESGREIRGMATVDDGTLWVYVQAVGPGSCDDAVALEARQMVADLWHSVHIAAAQA
jgi:secreted PhoX family phosphatase